jgi:hypothetical protein
MFTCAMEQKLQMIKHTRTNVFFIYIFYTARILALLPEINPFNGMNEVSVGLMVRLGFIDEGNTKADQCFQLVRTPGKRMAGIESMGSTGNDLQVTGMAGWYGIIKRPSMVRGYSLIF